MFDQTIGPFDVAALMHGERVEYAAAFRPYDRRGVRLGPNEMADFPKCQERENAADIEPVYDDSRNARPCAAGVGFRASAPANISLRGEVTLPSASPGSHST